MKMKSRLLTVLSALGFFACLSQAAMATNIYRGITEDGESLDLSESGFEFVGGTLSFNTTLVNITSDCAFALTTTNSFSSDNSSPIDHVAGFTATSDQDPPIVPAGHVSVTQDNAGANPARDFADIIATAYHADIAYFNENHIHGVNLSDEECREKAKNVNQ